VLKLVVLALAATFAAPPEATRDLAAAERLAAANDAAASRATAIVQKSGVVAPFVDRLGLRLERLAPGLRYLGLTRAQADRLATTAELVL
jgi:hypothetical protein